MQGKDTEDTRKRIHSDVFGTAKYIDIRHPGVRSSDEIFFTIKVRKPNPTDNDIFQNKYGYMHRTKKMDEIFNRLRPTDGRKSNDHLDIIEWEDSFNVVFEEGSYMGMVMCRLEKEEFYDWEASVTKTKEPSASNSGPVKCTKDKKFDVSGKQDKPKKAYRPIMDQDDPELIILNNVFDAELCLEYAKKHYMDVLFTETRSDCSAEIIMSFQKKGFLPELREIPVYAPGGLELSPKIVCYLKSPEVRIVENTEGLKIKEEDFLSPDDIRSVCVAYDYFTRGNNDDYESVLNFFKNDTNITPEKLYRLACYIADHSYLDCYTSYDEFVCYCMCNLSRKIKRYYSIEKIED